MASASSLARGTGYRLQMLIKLMVATWIATPFYITLDSDVFACKRVTYGDLVDERGRALIQGEPREGTRHQRRWWGVAEQILASPGCVLGGRTDAVVGVTPAVLSTNISVGLLREVERLYKEPFDQWMFKQLNRCRWRAAAAAAAALAFGGLR